MSTGCWRTSPCTDGGQGDPRAPTLPPARWTTRSTRWRSDRQARGRNRWPGWRLPEHPGLATPVSAAARSARKRRPSRTRLPRDAAKVVRLQREPQPDMIAKLTHGKRDAHQIQSPFPPSFRRPARRRRISPPTFCANTTGPRIAAAHRLAGLGRLHAACTRLWRRSRAATRTTQPCQLGNNRPRIPSCDAMACHWSPRPSCWKLVGQLLTATWSTTRNGWNSDCSRSASPSTCSAGTRSLRRSRTGKRIPQMGMFVLLTVVLRQKGSPESRPMSEADEDRSVDAGPTPWPRACRWTLEDVYGHSLAIAFGVLS